MHRAHEKGRSPTFRSFQGTKYARDARPVVQALGSGTVVGAGSVVTRDLPEGVVAVGNPCRVLRSIGESE